MARSQIQLPEDGTGKSTLSFDFTEPGNPAPNNGVRHLQGLVLCDAEGREIQTLPTRIAEPLPPGTNTIGHVRTELEAVTLLNFPSVARTTSGQTAAMDSGKLSRIAFDANITAVGGIGPSMTLFIDRFGADGVWYPIAPSPAITAPRTFSTSVGQGMRVGESLAGQIRMRWVITGTDPSFTFTASIVGK